MLQEGSPGKLDNSLSKANLPQLLVRCHSIPLTGGVEDDLVMDCFVGWAKCRVVDYK